MTGVKVNRKEQTCGHGHGEFRIKERLQLQG